MKNWKRWISLAFIVKTGMFCFTISQFTIHSESYGGAFLLASGDSFSYFDPVENLISNGHYADDHRMPGIGWIYFLLRLFLNPFHASG